MKRNETMEKSFLHSLKLRLNAIDGYIRSLTVRRVRAFAGTWKNALLRVCASLFANTSFGSFALAHYASKKAKEIPQ